MELFDVLEHHGTPCVLQERWRGSAGLNDRAAWAQIAAQNDNACFVFKRFIEWHDDIGVVVHRVGEVLADGEAIGCHRI